MKKLKKLFCLAMIFLAILIIINLCLSCKRKEGFNDSDWQDGLAVTHYYDCNGQACDAPLLQPWNPDKFITPKGYMILDPNDFGGPMHGEKMWLYGAASDDLAKLLGDNVPGLGHPDSSSGPNFGCGRSILIKNPAAKNSDWTALVMRKNRCPPWSNGCEAGKIHMDLMIPGFDDLQYSTSNICGKPGTAMSKEQSSICGTTTPVNCNSCDKLPAPFVKGCKLFVGWGWPNGNPTCQYKLVTTPPKFIEYTKKVQLGSGSSPSPSPPSPPSPECDCSWTGGGKNCGTDDGTHCWKVCCGSSPAPAPTPPAPPPPAPSPPAPPPLPGPPPPSSTCNRTPKEGQCGGKAWTGETCCPDGYKCTPQNEWYSQCLVK